MKKFAAKELYIHGTSSKFIPTILSQGLVPRPKERADIGWKTPYEGSYLSKNILTSRMYAHGAVGKFGGVPAYVFAMIEQRSPEVVIDEDELAAFLYSSTTDDVIHALSRQFPDIPARRWEARRGDIEAYIKDVRGTELKNFSPEQNVVRDKLLKGLKDVVRQSESVRFKDKAIGFRGSNKIVAVVKIDGWPSGRLTVVPVYGNLSEVQNHLHKAYEDKLKAA